MTTLRTRFVEDDRGDVPPCSLKSWGVLANLFDFRQPLPSVPPHTLRSTRSGDPLASSQRWE